MTKWEYATVPLLVHATKQILDTWGVDGWELVQVVPGPGGGGELVATGKVGAEVTPEVAAEAAAACALNALAAIRGEVGDLSAVRRVVKVVVFVASAPGFTGQPGVANGASELLGKVFGDAGVHARSAVGVAVLPLDVPVEVELVVEVG